MTDKVPKTTNIYYCSVCDYNTSRKSQYDRHILTGKHIRMTNNDANVPNSSKLYNCDCGKIYKYRQGLFAHRKICNYQCSDNDDLTSQPITSNIDATLVMELLKQNSDFKQMMIEQNKQILDKNEKITE